MKSPDVTPNTSAGLESALRYLAANPDKKVEEVAARHRVTKQEVWDWLGRHNRGKKDLSVFRIDNVLAAERSGALPIAAASPGAIRISQAVKKSKAVETVVKPPLPSTNVGRWLEQQKIAIKAQVQCFQVEVTPAVEASWLLLNQGNRKPSRAKILRFAAAMKANKWQLNGETVKFSSSGRLLDGQSRLQAIVHAGIPAVLEIRGALPDAVQQSMDVGELRKGAHMLEMMGEKYPAILSPALKLISRWEQSGTFGGGQGSRHKGENRILENMDIGPLLARHSGLKASVGWCVSAGHKLVGLMPAGEAAAMHYLLGLSSISKRDAFFSQLATGLGLTATSPAYHLRERLQANRLEVTRLTAVDRLGLVIKAWNAHHAGTAISKLVFRTDGDRREAFPSIAGVKAPAKAA